MVAEGFALKALALRSAGVKGVIVGWGARSWLRNRALPPSIKRLIIVPDRAPDEHELGEDGKPLLEGHVRDYRRAADFWLLGLGEDAVWLAPDPGALGKDADESCAAPAPRRCAR